MIDSTSPKLLGLTPYLYYEDPAGALEWLGRVCGFEEISRFVDPNGIVQEAEMRVGDQEIWMAGMGPGYWQKKGSRPDQLMLVWVNDVDAHHARTVATGVEAEAPEDKPYAVRMYTLCDPEGYQWGFAQRLEREVQLAVGWSEVRPDGSIRTA